MRHAPLRESRLIDLIRDLGYEVADLGNVDIVRPQAMALPGENPKYLPEVLASSANIASAVRQSLDSGSMPVIPAATIPLR